MWGEGAAVLNKARASTMQSGHANKVHQGKHATETLVQLKQLIQAQASATHSYKSTKAQLSRFT